MSRCRPILMFFLLLNSLQSNAQSSLQRLKHTVYYENTGLSDKVILDIQEDSTGLIWFISENNLYWFDGSEFNKIPHGNGIHQVPGNVFLQLYRSPENEIWVIYKKGYSVYNPSTHSFTHYRDIIPAHEQETFSLVSERSDELLFVSDNNSFTVNRSSKKISGFSPNGGSLFAEFPYSIHKGYTLLQKNDSILFRFADRRPDFALKKQAPLESFSLYNFNDSIVVYGTQYNISLYSNRTGRLIAAVDFPDNKTLQAYRKPVSIIQKSRKELVVFLDDEMWLFNLDSVRFTHRIVSVAGKNFISNGYFKKGMFDSNGNLWVTSNLNGIMRISFRSQPIHLIGKDGEDDIFIKCFKVNKAANLVLAGTYGKGLFVYDTSGNLRQHFPLQQKEDVSSIVTSIGQLDEDNYLILAFYDFNQYILNIPSMSIRSIHHPLLKSPGYYSELTELKPGEFLYPKDHNSFYKINWVKKELAISVASEADKWQMLAMGSLKVQQHNATALTGNDYFFKCIRQISLGDAGRIVIEQKGNHWLFGTIKGIYEFDGQAKMLNAFNMQSGLADEYIYAIVVDNSGDIWCSHNKGISRISRNGSVLNLGKEDGLQSDEFNFGAAAKTADGQLFFGGVKGLNSFYPSLINRQLETPRLIVTHISSSDNKIPEDTAFWKIRSLELPFARNSIHIVFSAIGNNSGISYNYQYRVKGLFDEWKNLGHVREINLALPSGDYVVEIACGNSFMKEALPQQSISIRIIPPVYQRWWFISLAILAGLGICAWVVQLINRQRFQKKLSILRTQQQVETERRRISRDLHDNMGAYTTALLSNVEKLRHQNGDTEELKKMSSNAQQILNSLRETIWVLNNKEISVADFCDAFKNHCIKMLQNFETIHFESEEKIVNNKKLSAAEAIHYDKILKEAFQNILKHSGATQIIFKVKSDDGISFSIEDNGTGFEPDLISKGNGLDNMQWRAKEAGAELRIAKNRNNNGMTISLTK
ncbi:MAG: histidine kinase [Ferruginibacter sp.]